MTTAVAYVRVSKKDGTQTTENQIPEIHALAAARGFTLGKIYEDRESAMKRRPGFHSMMTALRSGKHGHQPTLMIWSLDRLGRGVSSFDTYRELVQLGVRVASCREPWLEQEGPTRELLAMLMSWISGYERSRLIERTKAGILRARESGTRIGRPPADVDAAAVSNLRAQGLTLHQIGERIGVSHTTVARVLKGQLALNETGHENGAVNPAQLLRSADAKIHEQNRPIS